MSEDHRRSKDHWSVSKEVSIGNIITTLTAVVVLIIFLITNRNDIDTNTDDIAKLNDEKHSYITKVQAEGDHNLLGSQIDSVANEVRNAKNSANRNGTKLEKIMDILLEMQREISGK